MHSPVWALWASAGALLLGLTAISALPVLAWLGWGWFGAVHWWDERR